MIKWFKRFIERLGETNKKEFGSEKLDCCGLNSNGPDNKGKTQNTSEDKEE